MNPDSVIEHFPQLQSMASQTVTSGELSLGTSVLLLAMVFAAWKMPWALSSSRFKIACWAFFVNLASPAFAISLGPSAYPNFFATLPLLSFAVAVLYFLLSLTKPPQSTEPYL